MYTYKISNLNVKKKHTLKKVQKHEKSKGKGTSGWLIFIKSLLLGPKVAPKPNMKFKLPMIFCF